MIIRCLMNAVHRRTIMRTTLRHNDRFALNSSYGVVINSSANVSLVPIE
uniref:Uncharacterized protein n=1 Tax=Arundo donax TaxID=35708 RepID=A0A0A9F7F4_ARUDO